MAGDTFFTANNVTDWEHLTVFLQHLIHMAQGLAVEHSTDFIGVQVAQSDGAKERDRFLLRPQRVRFRSLDRDRIPGFLTNNVLPTMTTTELNRQNGRRNCSST